jgi:hypothetical protein
MSNAETKPWARTQLDQNVLRRIRDCANDVLVIRQDDDDTKVAALKPGGDAAFLDAFYKAIEEAGWQLLPKT